MPESDPNAGQLPAAYRTEHARLKLELDAARRRMRRVDILKFVIWAVASVVLIIGLITPWDVTGFWLVLALGACFAAHSWTAGAWNNATGRFAHFMFEAQFLAATAMMEAHKRGELDIRE